MRFLISRIALSVPVVVALGGCTPIRPPGKSPLVRPRMSPDSVVLDIFFVRFPFGDEEANGPLWDEIDEQQFPMELRRELARNGFRAGVVGGQIPVGLSRLLELTAKPPPSEQVHETSLEDLDSTPTVVRRHKELRAGKRCEITTSGIYDELPVVLCESAGLCGKSYSQAQGILAIKAFPEPDGRVRLELVPELHYGQPRQQYMSSHGAVRLEVGRPRRVFHELTLSTRLAAGQMIVLGSLDRRPGSLGHHFFTRESDGQLEQKLLVIRLSQTQRDDLFDPDGLLPLNEPGESSEPAAPPAS